MRSGSDVARYKRRDYGKNPHEGANRNNASSRGWGSGWPHCQGKAMAAAKGGGISVQVRREVAPLVAALLAATEALGYAPIPGQCGGFACRAIRGSSQASNHSWGLAIDLNWPRNPMGNPFRSEIPPAVVHLWESAGWFWGGRYKLRPDTMHFEYLGTPHDVRVDLATVGGQDAPDVAVPAPIGRPTLSRGSKGPDVVVLQRFLGVRGANGVFGAKTEAAVRRYQETWDLTVDGVVGPKTWAPILGALKKGHE